MEIAIGVVVSLIAVAAIVSARQFPSTGLSTDIGSARFPTIYSAALLILCAILIGRHLKKRWGARRANAAPDAAASQGAPAQTDAPDYRKSITGITASVICLVAMPYAGFALTAGAYLSFLMWLLGMKHKLLNPLLAVSITAIVHLTFSNALNVPLPTGSLFEATST